MVEKSTKELTDELVNCEGITTLEVAPYEEVVIKKGLTINKIVGPAIIVINQD